MNKKHLSACLLKVIFTLALFVCLLQGRLLARAAEPIIVDKADLLTEEEEQRLTEAMKPILEYGGVALVTNGENDAYEGYASDLAKKYCKQFFGGESGTVLLIDMYDRRIEIYSTGKLYRYITKTNANIITTNAYTYATKGNYADCAEVCFEQMLEVAAGGRINTPLRYLSNFLAALAAALFLTYVVAYISRSSGVMGKTVDNVDSYRSNMDRGTVKIFKKDMVKQRKTVHSESSGGSGGSSGGSSGGGGGGGGGGGHSF